MPTIPHIIPKLSTPIIDEIDEWPAKHSSFAKEELDFTINHDTKYRSGDKLSGGDE
jgi:hypothetical protein